jgi:hypothetical protein
MNKLLCLSCAVILITVKSEGQQQASDPLIYSRILIADSVTKGDIYDRALIWCSKSFANSKSAINVKDKESGIIAGKGSIDNYYKIPRKKDSVSCIYFTDYLFDWLIEIKDSKARLSLKNIKVRESDIDYPVTSAVNPPVKMMFQPPERQELIWDLSKKSFIKYMDAITENLYADLRRKNDNW